MASALTLATLIYCARADAQTATATPPQSPPTPAGKAQDPPPPSWGAMEPGQGFQVARTEKGDLWISAYMLARYINQLPANQTFTDHLGREHVIDTRNDIQWHRIQVFFKGFVYSQRLRYMVNLWTVNATNQVAVAGMLRFVLNKETTLGVGINAMPGTRTLGGSHPYWLAHDRVMSDEYFRPGFTSAAWIEGSLVPRVHYNVMVGTNLSQLGISAGKDTRDMATGASVYWVPTTGEFGPRGGFGDYEVHQKLATRFGFSTTRSREDRFAQLASATPDNTVIRLQDSLLLFETGSLARDVTIQKASYRIFSADAGMKYRGFFLATEFQHRWLYDFDADGPLPVSSIFDHGFYLTGSYDIKRANIEPYLSTSWVFGDKGAGFGTSKDVLGGLNVFPLDTRNVRLNGQVIWVNRSPVSSVFGYYTGGLKGPIISAEVSVLF